MQLQISRPAWLPTRRLGGALTGKAAILAAIASMGSDPMDARVPFIECLYRQPSFTYTTTFTVLSLCVYCMGIIRPESKWKNRCRTLLKTATPFVLRGMGAPAGWDSLALWQ